MQENCKGLIIVFIKKKMMSWSTNFEVWD